MDYLLRVHLKLGTCIALLLALTGLFQLHLSVQIEKNKVKTEKNSPRPLAQIDYRYAKGGIFMIVLACLVQYLVLLFNF